jgi:microcystin-dependent protein
LNISQYPALFELIKTKYGGDGVTTFCIPDLQTYSDASKTKSVPPYYFICVEGDAPSDYGKNSGILAGCLQFFAFDFVPKYFTKCEGQRLKIKEGVVDILYSLVGNRFSGDYEENFFYLPDLREVKIAGHNLNCCIANYGLFPNKGFDFTVETYIGMIVPYVYSFSPFGAKCNGGTLTLSEHGAVCHLLGNTFGGNEAFRTHGLPNIAPIKVKTPKLLWQEIPYAMTLEGFFPRIK